MANKKAKQVRLASAVPTAPAKIPRVESGVNFYSLKPAWRISKLELCDPFGWHEVAKEKLFDIHSKLAAFESLTWKEILLVQKKRNHLIQVEDICKEAKARLAKLRLDDYEEIISLRLSGAERVWGIPQMGALTLLWWDPNHEVYPYELPNT